MRPTTAVAVLLLASRIPAAQEAPADPRFQAIVEVTRILTEVRVVDRSGNPVTGLAAGDFQVRVHGEPAVVEAVRWIDTSTQHETDTAPPGGPAEHAAAAATPQLYVVLVQTDLEASRLTGLIRVSRHAKEFVRELPPADRVALAVFGSHLRLAVDFGEARERVLSKLNAPALLRARHVDVPGSPPSLAAHLDPEVAAEAADLTEALVVLGEALEPIPGPKSVLLLGWGLGTFTASGVKLGPDYPDAIEALAAARTTVFTLDVSDADYHSLEVGLEAVSDHTGGTYAKTHLFPQLAVRRLARVLSGHYELSVVPPADMPDGVVDVEVDVDLPGASVLHRPYHVTSD